jgi:hypothetical protein
MDYHKAIKVLVRMNGWSQERAAETLDLELSCLPDEHALQHIKESFPDGWLNEHEKWLKSRIDEILTELLHDTFQINHLVG